MQPAARHIQFVGLGVVITSLSDWRSYVEMKIVDAALFACSLTKPIKKGMDPFI